jgi:hypothetical protein
MNISLHLDARYGWGGNMSAQFERFLPWIKQCADGDVSFSVRKTSMSPGEWQGDILAHPVGCLAIIQDSVAPSRIAGTYILLDSSDGPDLTQETRAAMLSPNPPALVWKHYRYADLETYRRVTGPWFAQTEEPSAFTDEQLAGIRAPFGWGAYWGPRGRFIEKIGRDVLEFPEERALNADRTIDVSFCGTLNESVEPIKEHRLACRKAIRSLPKGITWEISIGPPVSWAKYCDLLFRSKIVVSPWGHGEYCFRDYEAVHAGCLIIKPSCGHIAHDWIYHHQCARDFSNLADVVNGFLQFCPKMSTCHPQCARSQLIEHNSPASVASRLWADIKELVGVAA